MEEPIMDNETISIVLPTYNVREFIPQCIDSLICQTYENLEIIIIDDGSTDGTGPLCDVLAQKDARIRVIHKENGGTHTGRNLGIKEATGQYIMFLDPDDWLDPETFRELMEKIREYDPDVIRFSYVREFPDHSALKENTFLPEDLCEGEDCKKICRQTLGLVGQELRHPENMNYLSSACFAVYKKSVIEENGLEFFNIHEIATFSDGFFNIRFLQKANRFLYVDKPYYHYRKFSSGAATTRYREEFLARQMRLFQMLQTIAQEEGSEEFRKAFHSRVIFSTMEICLNALKGKRTFRQQYREMKQVLRNPLHREAFQSLDTGVLPMKWKVYYSLAKTGMVFPVFLMTKAIRFIQRKG